jgi:predicted dehydrogenase
MGPASVRYLVNAGQLESSSWYLRSDSEGSRFVGEGGHFVDTVSWLLGADPVSVFAAGTPDQHDVQATLRYPDGSTAVITYATSGSSRFPKETIELLADGSVLRFDDFARAAVHGRARWRSPRLPRGRDKGQRAQVAAFVDAVRAGTPMPIDLESLATTTAATLAVSTSLATGAVVALGSPETQA